jgi:hypothetical protein
VREPVFLEPSIFRRAGSALRTDYATAMKERKGGTVEFLEFVSMEFAMFII